MCEQRFSWLHLHMLVNVNNTINKLKISETYAYIFCKEQKNYESEEVSLECVSIWRAIIGTNNYMFSISIWLGSIIV
jgi:hypothetical protein